MRSLAREAIVPPIERITTCGSLDWSCMAGGCPAVGISCARGEMADMKGIIRARKTKTFFMPIS